MTASKIDFLNTLFKRLQCRMEILQFLKTENVINDDTVAHLINEPHNTHAQLIFSLLNELQKKEKVQLVDYEWTILPKEFLKLTLVTDNSKKEFTYSV